MRAHEEHKQRACRVAGRRWATRSISGLATADTSQSITLASRGCIAWRCGLKVKMQFEAVTPIVLRATGVEGRFVSGDRRLRNR